MQQQQHGNDSFRLRRLGYQHFALGVSLPLMTEQLLAVLRRLVGGGRRVDVSHAPSKPDADIVATVVAGDETCSPRTLFECWSDAGLEELGPYPDLQFAVELWREYGADSYCDFYPFADDGLQPRDPHRFLASVKGRWWVATVVFPPGATGSGGESVRLVRPVDIPSCPAAT
jgi:hypothetical protein